MICMLSKKKKLMKEIKEDLGWIGSLTTVKMLVSAIPIKIPTNFYRCSEDYSKTYMEQQRS